MPLLAPHTCRILEFFRTNFKSVKPYDHAKMLERLPFDLRSQVSDILYLPTIKVWEGCGRYENCVGRDVKVVFREV